MTNYMEFGRGLFILDVNILLTLACHEGDLIVMHNFDVLLNCA